MIDEVVGRVNSIQSLGALDGPGLRFVVFMQGCNLRCGCCHNPDTWKSDEGVIYTASHLCSMAARYKEYFGELGGITVSGGEPLLQADFVRELFSLCHKEGINTCLDTSGSVMNDSVRALLLETDRVLLDVKYPDNEGYRRYVGCDLDRVLSFLNCINEMGIPTVLRQVTIPGLTDTKESVLFLKKLQSTYPCVEKIELLPFKKLCSVKYGKLGIDFPFKDIPTPSPNKMKELEEFISGK